MNAVQAAPALKSTRVPAMPVSENAASRQCSCGQHTPGGGECEQCRSSRVGLPRASIRPEVLPVTGSASRARAAGWIIPAMPRPRGDFSQVPVLQRAAKEGNARRAGMLDAAAVMGEEITPGEEAPSEEAAPANPPAQEAAPAASPAEPATAGAPGLIAEDDAQNLAPGQLRKVEFLAQLRSAVCDAANTQLAVVGRSTEGCPYLEHWFSYLNGRSGGQIERSIHRYAPEADGVATATAYIPLITARVGRAVATWASTGQVTGVPEGISAETPGEPGSAAEAEPPKPGAAAPETAALASTPADQIHRASFKGRPGVAYPSGSPLAIQSRLGTGTPLESGLRARMETAFGQDFSQVRLHRDARAASLSSEMNARAFTVGRDVAFGTGEYQPGTLIGDALIAHELAHVVQQQGSVEAAAQAVPVSSSQDTYLEADADRSAVGAMAMIWGGLKGAVQVLGQKAFPRIRSGLLLQRCSSDRTLSKKTISGPTAGNCGASSWVIQWVLNNAAGGGGGWVVQHLKAVYNVSNSAGGIVDNKTWDYQEAWEFHAGKTVTIYAEGGDLEDDTYSDSSYGAGTKGKIVVTGSASYYDGLTLPSDFSKNNPATQAHILPSTTTIHTLPGGTNVVSHDETTSWDCTTGASATKIESYKGKSNRPSPASDKDLSDEHIH